MSTMSITHSRSIGHYSDPFANSSSNSGCGIISSSPPAAHTMDNRFSHRWSTLPDSQPATISSPLPHVSAENHALANSYANNKNISSTGPRSSKQRWSAVPPTSSLSIVETIDYEEVETPTSEPATPRLGKRRHSIANLKAAMRQIFSKRERDAAPPIPTIVLPTKPAFVEPKSMRTTKSDPIVLKNISEKETHLWNRLSVVVRLPKSLSEKSRPSTPAKRVDSVVDIQNLKETTRTMTTLASPKGVFKTQSTTSLPSFPTHARNSSDTMTIAITGPSLLLTRAERTHLVTALQAAQTLIQSQTHETEAFSKNLAGLLWSKERYIVANRRISEETRLQMVDTMAKVRDVTAKTFARKGAFFERSLSVLEKLLNELNAGCSSGNGNGTSASSLRSISPDSTLSTALTLTNSPSSSSSSSSSPDEKHEVPLTLSTLRSGLQTLKADLTAHSHLDPALRNGVVKPTKENRFPATENERLAMQRFVRFVDGRIKVLREGYWEMGRWVRGLEGWVDDLEEGGGC